MSVPLGAPETIEAVVLAGDQISRPLRVLWAGAFTLRKGAHYFAQAWRELSPGGNAQATVFGSIGLPEAFVETHCTTIRFAGSAPAATLFSAYADADVLMFPTLSDGFGMVVTEALSRGLPVIATNQAGAADLIQHGVNGLIIEAGDSDAIKDALVWCLDNRPRLAEMRFAALETARHRQWRHFRADLIRAVECGLR